MYYCGRDDCQICKMDSGLSGEWADCLRPEFRKPYFRDILRNLHDCVKFFPKPQNIFRFTRYFDISETKVVILGQDPYPGPLATGLAFSTPENCTDIPPSIYNIFREVYKYGGQIPDNGCVEHWAMQGVLLLNAVLTVEYNEPRSHSDIGWEELTDHIIEYISDRCINVVFMLWGNDAKEKEELIDRSKHLVLTAGHPSPNNQNDDFIGCNHFNRANGYLRWAGKQPINWR